MSYPSSTGIEDAPFQSESVPYTVAIKELCSENPAATLVITSCAALSLVALLIGHSPDSIAKMLNAFPGISWHIIDPSSI